jgi:hypothetical protein
MIFVVDSDTVFVVGRLDMVFVVDMISVDKYNDTVVEEDI